MYGQLYLLYLLNVIRLARELVKALVKMEYSEVVELEQFGVVVVYHVVNLEV